MTVPVLLLLGVDDRGERRDVFSFPEAHDDHALRRATRAADPVDRHTNDRATGRDQHHLVALTNDACAGELAFRLGQLNGLHAESATALDRIVLDPRALAVAVL